MCAKGNRGSAIHHDSDVEGHLQVNPGEIERLLEVRLGLVIRAEKAFRHGVGVEKGVRVPPQIGHGVSEQVFPTGRQFVQHGCLLYTSDAADD